MEKVQKQVTQPMSYSEFTAQCDRLEREMRKELAPIEAKYWQAVVKTNLLHKEMEPLHEAYRAAWEANVIPHRRAINNIYRKYRRRMKKMQDSFSNHTLLSL